MTLFGTETRATRPDISLEAPLNNRFLATIRLAKLIRRESPDLLVSHGSGPLVPAMLASRGRVPVVYHRIGTALPQLRRRRHLLVHRALLRQVELVVCVGQSVADELRDLAPNLKCDVVVVNNGRDPSQFSPSSDHEDNGAVVVAFAGAFNHLKRPLLFLEVFRQLEPPVLARLAGTGPEFADVIRNAPATAEILGAINDVAGFLRSSDLFLFTSRPEQEGLPGVLIEAAMCGLPIVATDVPGAREVVKDGVTGFVVDHRDTAGLVAATQRLVSDNELRAAFGSAARTRALERFTIERSVNGWRDALATLLDT